MVCLGNLSMGLEDINPNRGLVQKPLPNGGPCISMVKSQPGVFYDAKGEICPDEMAESAGFDVVALKRQKAKSEELAKVTAEIEERFRGEKADATAAVEAGESPSTGTTGAPDLKGEEPEDGSPFVLTTAGDEPRVARATQDGPVKEMVYVTAGPDRGWVVRDRDSGRDFGIGLSKEEATELLLKKEEG